MSINVAVVGGGYSGTLLAIHLLERNARVTLIERSDRLARGIAYSTADPDHLLNVRASGMSAFPDRPDHFAEWLAARNAGNRDSFAPRRIYGSYLEELLRAAQARAGRRLLLKQAEVVDLRPADGRELVHLKSGEQLDAGAVVLALGNLPPDVPRVFAEVEHADDIYRPDPWAGDLAADLTSDDTVLLVGTGLTAIDAVIALDGAGFRGRILALSRRGLVPRAHAEGQAGVSNLHDAPEPRGTDLIRLVRARADQMGWRRAVDSLRPVTQKLWSQSGLIERRRFLRHLRPWWDVHRHRIAPEVAVRIARMVDAGQLEFASGRIVAVQRGSGAARLRWRLRATGEERSIRVRRIVNCTGPQADISRAREPLLDALQSTGRVRPDPCRIGVDVDEQCRVLESHGPSPTLRAVGPITKGAFWEIVAVPDIRTQVRLVASDLTCNQGG